MLSVIIPTLNAAKTLPRTIDAVAASASLLPCELDMVVSDGGSGDGTPDLARRLGARVVVGVPGRGGQLARGADAARGDWLLFLHADTQLSAGWTDAVTRFLQTPDAQARAAVFLLALDDDASAARRIERLANWRTRVLGLPYGDQGLLMSRAFYRALGGFDDVPLMEDVALVRRIGRGRLTVLDVPAVTSAARYRRDGYWARPVRNLVCLALYFLGVRPQRLVGFYAR